MKLIRNVVLSSTGYNQGKEKLFQKSDIIKKD